MRRDYLPLLAIHEGPTSDETGSLLRGGGVIRFCRGPCWTHCRCGGRRTRGGLGRGGDSKTAHPPRKIDDPARQKQRSDQRAANSRHLILEKCQHYFSNFKKITTIVRTQHLNDHGYLGKPYFNVITSPHFFDVLLLLNMRG